MHVIVKQAGFENWNSWIWIRQMIRIHTNNYIQYSMICVIQAKNNNKYFQLSLLSFVSDPDPYRTFFLASRSGSAENPDPGPWKNVLKMWVQVEFF